MATVVLVHGGWMGAWRWRLVAERLRSAGHAVYTPTLTGLGERVHLARPDVDLDTHVFDVANVLEAENLRDVTLVGHSYAGMVISGVAERSADRLARLVYLDAFVPRDGEALLDLLGPLARRMTEEAFERSDDGWRVLWPADGTPRPWPPATPRWSPQPWRTLTQPLPLGGVAERLPRIYVRCTAGKELASFDGDSFALSWRRAQGAGWRRATLEARHMGVYGEPGAALLLSLLVEATT